MIQKIIRFILPPLIVIVGLAGMVMLVKMKPRARKVVRPPTGMLVQTKQVETVSRSVEVRGYGEVGPAQQIDLQPQVTGQVLDMHEQMVPGGRIAKGETIMRLEAVDYEAQAAGLRAQVDRAEQELELERGRQRVAEREWKLLGKKGGDTAGRNRALRQPQFKSAKAALTTAKSNLRRARADVGRSKIKAPFNALVISESVDMGQVVRVGAAAARLVGTDEFWVQVAVPVADLDWIQIPKRPGDPGAKARVIHDVGGRRVERAGHVVRLLGDLEPMGRMARVVVAVDDPLSLDSDAPSLLLGAYVEVVIEGREIQNVVEIPRVALRQGDKAWTVVPKDFSKIDVALVAKVLQPLASLPGISPKALTGWKNEKVLAIQPVRVVRRMRDSVLVGDGLKPGEQLITSRIGAPVPGMTVRAERPAASDARAQVKP